MSAKHLFGAVSAMLVVSVAACASPSSEDSGAATGAASTSSQAMTARCATIRDTSDDVAQGELADKYADEDAAGYETCRQALVATAKELKDGDMFYKWATPDEVEADAVEDPAEAAPVAHDKGTVEVLVHDGMPKGVSSSAPISRVDISGGGIDVTNAPAATGRPGHRTPHGCYFAFKADKHHHSSTYNGASMPNSVFWYPAIATHTGSVYVASHGCVHLEDALSLKIYNAYEAGYKVHVCVQ